MKTRKLAAVAVAIAVVPALVSFGCNKKEDLAPAPSATQVATQPPPTPPPAATPTVAPAATPQRVVAKPAGDAGARDGSVVAAARIDAAVLPVPPGFPQNLPQIPTIQPSALPAIASGIVGGIVSALPSGLIPPPPAPGK
jgi:hypothetical protein